MVTPKHFREFFMQILNNLEQNLLQGQLPNEIVEQLETLDRNIIQSYEQITKLPKYSQDAIMKIFADNKNLKILCYRYNTLLQYEMFKEADLESKKIQDFVQSLKNTSIPREQHKNVDVNSRIKEVMQFLQPHITLVGEAQAVRDLQRGLSLLNKNRRQSPIDAKNILKQDGVYGNKTNACLCDVCKNYTPRAIKKYIKKGIQNNIIFTTKNNQNVDTKKMIDVVCANMERRV